MRKKRVKEVLKEMTEKRRNIMKVVLLEDVKSLGKKGDIVEVSEGYARNFIIPKKKGVEANQENFKIL